MIEFRSGAPDAAQYAELFETTGWNADYKVSAAELERALAASWHVECAYLEGRLVGLGRLVSDGVLYAMIYDLIVHPDCQGRGIGDALLGRLVDRCQQAGLRQIQLFSARGRTDFYRKRGFEPRPNDAPGMRLVACYRPLVDAGTS